MQNKCLIRTIPFTEHCNFPKTSEEALRSAILCYKRLQIFLLCSRLIVFCMHSPSIGQSSFYLCPEGMIGTPAQDTDRNIHSFIPVWGHERCWSVTPKVFGREGGIHSGRVASASQLIRITKPITLIPSSSESLGKVEYTVYQCSKDIKHYSF